MTLPHAQLRRATDAIRAGAVEPVTAEPMAGFYKTALCRGGPMVAVRTFFAPPLDPVAPRFVDRAPRWQACINGSVGDVDKVWPHAGKHPIGRAEYRYMLARYRWAIRYGHATGDPIAMPMQRIDLSTAAPLF